MVENVDEFPPLKYVSDISTTRQIDDQLSDNQVDTYTDGQLHLLLKQLKEFTWYNQFRIESGFDKIIADGAEYVRFPANAESILRWTDS